MMMSFERWIELITAIPVIAGFIMGVVKVIEKPTMIELQKNSDETRKNNEETRNISSKLDDYFKESTDLKIEILKLSSSHNDLSKRFEDLEKETIVKRVEGLEYEIKHLKDVVEKMESEE